MAEIKIEKKQPMWLWVLLVIGLLAAVWFIFFRNDKKETATTETASETAKNIALIDVRENNSAVAAYVTFTDSYNEMSLDHAYSSKALVMLTDATNAMATEVSYNITVDIAKSKQYAEEITKDPLVATHADKIRTSADLLSTALQNMQQAKYPTLSNEATDVKNAAAAINPAILALDQQNAIKSFFRKSADLLSKMN